MRYERGDLEDSNKSRFGATSPTETFWDFWEKEKLFTF